MPDNTVTKTNLISSVVIPYDFESYGVFVRIESNQQEMVDEAERVLKVSLLNNVRPVRRKKFDIVYRLDRNKRGRRVIIQNGEEIAGGGTHKKFFKFWESILRVAIAERAPGLVFLHAGVVGWKGQAIIIPADSFKGKSTLVSELVRNGAEYYSDEFAIIDAEGLVHPFARRIGRRTEDFRTYEITVEDLGGSYGHSPIPVGFVLITEYRPNAKWSPKILTPGQGILEIIPFTLCLRHRPDFSLKVLNNIATSAIITSSLRGTAEKFAETLLNFVDKHIN